MARPRPTPHLGLSRADAAHILGCSISHVQTLIADGELHADPRLHRQLDRDEVEQLAARHWKRPTTPDDGTSYWVTGRQAAEILGVGLSRVGQLVDRGALPCLRTPAGIRLFRRAQVEVIANARLSRRLEQA